MVLYPLLFQQFPIKHCDHPPFYGKYLGYGRVRVFADLTRVHNTVESGHYLYHCADSPRGVVKIEGEFYHRTTTPECSENRTAVPSVVKMEGELCQVGVYTRVSTLHSHTFEGLS